jgi:hypothetical protein
MSGMQRMGMMGPMSSMQGMSMGQAQQPYNTNPLGANPFVTTNAPGAYNGGDQIESANESQKGWGYGMQRYDSVSSLAGQIIVSHTLDISVFRRNIKGPFRAEVGGMVNKLSEWFVSRSEERTRSDKSGVRSIDPYGTWRLSLLV